MRAVGSAFACGLIFALGLGLSGMTQPSKVLGFLDVVPGAQGGWDPSLAFVMVGAIGVHAIFVRLARRATAPLFAERFVWPADGPVDRRLIAGACIFGIGWGLAGYCPGPALVGVASASPGVLLFVAAMGVGTVAAGASSITGSNRRQARQSHQASP